MVFFFTAKDGTPIYMGRDKFENEDLIKYGWPEDVWFHVDNLSSAHVYVRLPPGSGGVSSLPGAPAPGLALLDAMSEDAVRDCAQLVKENSIEGCKKASVTVVYTPWSNLKKTGGMEVGQVGFHSDRLVRKYVVLERDKETVRRVDKTRTERAPDFRAEREARDVEERGKSKADAKAKAAADKELADERRKEKELRSYDRLFKKPAGSDFGVGGADGGGAGNGGGGAAAEEDFMNAAAGGGGGGGGGGKGAAGGAKKKAKSAAARREEEEAAAAALAAAMGIKPTKDASAAKAVEEDFM